MPNKDRLLVLLQTLQEQSDDETWLTTAELRRALEAEGHECSIRTLRRDVKSLKIRVTCVRIFSATGTESFTAKLSGA